MNVPNWILQVIATVLTTEPIPDGWTKQQTEAVMVATAYAECGFRMVCRSGDGSVTTWQIRPRNTEHAKRLESDRIYAAKSALHIIREGARICPDAPLAPYIGGCKVPRARRHSEARMALARELVGDR